jgi:hypothetical protein
MSPSGKSKFLLVSFAHKSNFIKPRLSALAKGHFSKSICLYYSQSKEVYEDSKAC